MEQIIVCIKQVPDFSRVPEVPMDPQKGTIRREGIPSILNPVDRNAIEEALRLREALGGTITAITMGPPQARSVLHDALIMGADQGILLSSPAFGGGDTLATSHVLAAAIRRLAPFDLVICGRETSDSGTGHVAPSLAEWLDLPQITFVRKLEVYDGILRAEREIEDGYQEVEGPLPMVISVTKEINEPRPLRLRSVADAIRKGITTWGPGPLSLDPQDTGLRGSPTQVPRVFQPKPRQEAQVFGGSASEAVEALMARLRELRAI